MTAPTDRTEEPAQADVSIDEELRDAAAIISAFKALDGIDVSRPVLEQSETFTAVMFDTAHKFFDAAQAERARVIFENAVTKAGNIPDGARGVLLGLHELYDLKQFDSYGRAGIIVGIAAGLRGLGRQYLAPDELARARLRLARCDPAKTDGDRTTQPTAS